ncbi:hypothetical protein HDV57DRAFT_499074 [Trichoderma longibrachiatum]|uniref:Uncharacterized protein n=1 Tax=Trichoderma longibrachiatum ATCC 18648 TaxID=983965 RepID=A0A2T4C8U1_TRILO|nr:hypothetical protein M440DRAFT_1399171 [Trichoderma longibrachiatum ATCC 18648]
MGDKSTYIGANDLLPLITSGGSMLWTIGSFAVVSSAATGGAVGEALTLAGKKYL